MRPLITLLAAALVAASCGGSTTTSSSAGATTTTLAAGTTTTTVAEDDGRAELAAATRDLLDLIEERGVAATPMDAGTLAENGAFIDDLGLGGVPELDLDIRVLQDQDGLIWFAVFGDFEQVTSAWIEFDAVAEDGHTVVADTSVVGTGTGPPWVETATNGSVIVLEVPDDPVDAFRGGSVLGRVGYLIRGNDIAVGEGGFRPAGDVDGATLAVSLSLWIYRATGEVPSTSDLDAIWAYSHLVVEFASTPLPVLIESPVETYLRAMARAQLNAAELLLAALGPTAWIVPLLNSAD